MTDDDFHKVANWCSLTDAAERCQRNERTIRRWIKAEDVRSKRIYQQIWVYWPDVAAREAR
jgi:hypothetical protein